MQENEASIKSVYNVLENNETSWTASEKWSSIVHLDMKSPLITKQTAQHTSHSPQAGNSAQISRKLVLGQGAQAEPNQQRVGCSIIMTHPVDPPGQITSCLSPLKDYWCPSVVVKESGTFRDH